MKSRLHSTVAAIVGAILVLCVIATVGGAQDGPGTQRSFPQVGKRYGVNWIGGEHMEIEVVSVVDSCWVTTFTKKNTQQPIFVNLCTAATVVQDTKQ